jgi:hypothetical protein
MEAVTGSDRSDPLVADVLGCGQLDLTRGLMQRASSGPRLRPGGRFRQHAAALEALTRLRQDLEAEGPESSATQGQNTGVKWDVRHPAFDPRSYLFEVHVDTSYQELERGLEELAQRRQRLEKAYLQAAVHSLPAYLTTIFTLLPELEPSGSTSGRTHPLEQLESTFRGACAQLRDLFETYHNIGVSLSAWQYTSVRMRIDPEIGMMYRRFLTALFESDAAAAAAAAAVSYNTLIELRAQVRNGLAQREASSTGTREWTDVTLRSMEFLLQRLRFCPRFQNGAASIPSAAFWKSFDETVEQIWAECTEPRRTVETFYLLRLDVASETLRERCDAHALRLKSTILRSALSAVENTKAEVPAAECKFTSEIPYTEVFAAAAQLVLAYLRKEVIGMSQFVANLLHYVDAARQALLGPILNDAEREASARLVQVLRAFIETCIDISREAMDANRWKLLAPDALTPELWGSEALAERLKGLLETSLQALGADSFWTKQLK